MELATRKRLRRRILVRPRQPKAWGIPVERQEGDDDAAASIAEPEVQQGQDGLKVIITCLAVAATIAEGL